MSADLDHDHVKITYYQAASDYYVAARFAFWTQADLVCCNLFHHAIELYMKGHLYPGVSFKELQALGHNLPRIWDRVKATTSTDLARFDQMIVDVHAFEAVRYPDNMFSKFRVMMFHLSPRRADLEASNPTGTAVADAEQFQLALEEVDQFVRAMSEISGWNPRVFLAGLSGRDARLEYLLKSNSAWNADEVRP